MAESAHTSYDLMPYPNLSYSRSHPDSLASMATLLGMSPAPVERCRVLELACAVGGNLIPMAYTVPDSDFIGIDASGGQVAEGQTAVAALGLKNITLRQMDILDVDPSLGKFDYIVAHGVYSWVNEEVQERILEICGQHLAPNGVSYVSYNTYPGWHMINVIRGIMLYHTRNGVDSQERAVQGRSVLRELAECPSEDSAYGSFLRMYSEFLDGKLEDARPRSDALLLHDEMEAINEPVYFHQFAERAERHGLQYLADFHHMGSGELAPEVSKKLKGMAKSIIELEQYLDFVQNRSFRQTLLCHQGTEMNRTIGPEQVASFFVASRAQPAESSPDIHSVSVVRFRGHDGAILSTDHPVSKAAMLCLAEVWPQSVSFGELLSAARARLRPAIMAERASGLSAAEVADVDAQVLGANLLTGYGYSDSLVELHAYRPPIAMDIGERPVASAVARFQAESGDRVTNLRHERVTVDGFDRYLLRHLDGSHDRSSLVDLLLAGPVKHGILTVQRENRPSADLGDLLIEEVERRLSWLARAALFVSPEAQGEGADDRSP